MCKYLMSKLWPNRRRKKVQVSAALPGLPASEAEGQDSIIDGGVFRLGNAPIQVPTASSTDPPGPSSSPRPTGTTEAQSSNSIDDAIRTSAHAIATKPFAIASSSGSGTYIPEVKLEPAAPAVTLTPKISTETDSTVSTPNSGVLGTSAATPSRALNLWRLAVDKLEDETRKNIAGSGDDIDLVKALIDEINKKKKACNAKRWFYTNSKGENIFYVEALVGQLNKYAQLGDVALQHHPDIVALAWSGFRFLLQVGTAYTGDMRTVSESLEYIVRTLFCCDIYERLYCGTSQLSAVQYLNTSLVDLYVSILKYLCYVKKYLGENTGTRVLQSFFSDLKTFLDIIREKESLVLVNVDIAEKEASAAERKEQRHETGRLKALLAEIKEPLKNIKDAVEAVYREIKRDRKLKILNWLSEIKFIDHHQFARERRQKNTGLWLRENKTFVEWRDSESSSLLWLRGDAGYGKTTLVSYVIDELRENIDRNECVLAYFYCNYKEDDRRKPDTVLRTLIKQFCLKDPGDPEGPEDPNLVPARILSLYEQREGQGHASGGLRHQESTDLILKLSEMYLQVIIIVDALDECYQDTRNVLFYALKSLVDAGSNIKVFLASRYEQDIERMFDGYKCHYIQPSDNTNDINNYIDLQLDLRCDARRCGAEKLLLVGEVDDALKEEISRTLKEKANGMFMWVNLQILALCEEPTASCVREALKKLPKDLKETYDRIIERTQTNESYSRIAQSVLSWLLSAQEPCSLSTILQGLAVGPGEDKFDPDILRLTLPRVLDCCKNLIVNDSNTQNLRFAHFSVQEYLLGNPKFKEGSINHATMAEICLKVLLYHHSESKSRQEIGFLMKYAIKHWATHVRLSGSPPQSTLYERCIEFLKPSTAYNLWVSAAKEEDDPFKVSETTFVSPFWVACYYRLCDFFNVETSSEKILNEVNHRSWTPLSWAAEKGRDQVVKLLLRDSRIDVNRANKRGWTPLSWVAEDGHDKVVELLLGDSRTDVNIADTEYGRTPLLWAVQKGHDKVVELLLGDSRTDVNIADTEYGRTPLLWAVEKGHDKVVELLLWDSRIDVNRADKHGRTPLMGEGK